MIVLRGLGKQADPRTKGVHDIVSDDRRRGQNDLPARAQQNAQTTKHKFEIEQMLDDREHGDRVEARVDLGQAVVEIAGPNIAARVPRPGLLRRFLGNLDTGIRGYPVARRLPQSPVAAADVQQITAKMRQHLGHPLLPKML
ncbi:MAG: hypothetical protein AAGC57_02605 [Pseudomonadota bacterium]